MKTPLIIDANLGQTRACTMKTLLGMAMRKVELEVIDNPNDAGMAIVLGDPAPSGSTLNGKNAWLGDISQAATHPRLFLSEVKGYTKPYTAPVTATAPVAASGPRRVVAVIACPAGVAHTLMVAEAIETGAKKRGWWVRVETHGSVGAGNAITPEGVTAADLVIIAADIEVDLAEFVGRPMYHTFASLTLEKTAQKLDKAAAEATPYGPAGKTQIATTEGKKESAGTCRHLLTGVSHMLPMVVTGGLCIAFSFALDIEAFKELGTLAAALMQIGGGPAFALVVPVLAGYTAFFIADRPGLMPGLISGMLAVSTGSGLTGGIVASFLAGHITKLISTQLKLLQSMEALEPILTIPLISSLVVGLAVIYLIDKPTVGTLNGLTHWLQTVEAANTAPLGTILGGMMCTDMDDPVNKAAYAFGIGLLSAQIYGPVAAIMIAGMMPPLAMGLATMMARRKPDEAQREGGKAALILGPCSISEGAVLSAACDPMRVLLCCIVGGVLTGVVSMTIGAELMVPYGGLFVLLIPGAITPILGCLVAIITGTLVMGLAYASLKRPETQIVEKNA